MYPDDAGDIGGGKHDAATGGAARSRAMEQVTSVVERRRRQLSVWACELVVQTRHRGTGTHARRR